MAKYELKDDQIQWLQNKLATMQITGVEAPMIIAVSQALGRAVPEKQLPLPGPKEVKDVKAKV